MRYLLQILSLLILVIIGWTTPFSDVARMIMPWAQIPPSRLGLIKAKARDAANARPATLPGSNRPAFTPSNAFATPRRR